MLPQITILQEVCTSLNIKYIISETEPNLLCVYTPHPHVFFKCVTPFNSDIFNVISKKKHLTYSVLKDKIAMPMTSIVRKKDIVKGKITIESVLQQSHFPTIVKINSGKMGRHVYKCMNPEQAHSDTIALIQEYIPFVTEYRVIVFQGTIVFAYYKTYKEKKFATEENRSAYRHNEIPIMINDQVIVQRLQDFLRPLYKNISFDFAGVDLLEDGNGKLYLLELNTQPGLYNVLQHGGHDVVRNMYTTMLQYLSQKQ